MADYNLKININGVDTAIASIEDLEAALKANSDEMKTLQVGSEAFKIAAKNARTLESELKNIKLATEGIDNKQLISSFAKLGESVTGAFAVATNAIALFGSESQDVAKAQAQAQQSIAIVLGARAVAEGVVEGAAAARLVVDKASVVTTQILSTVFGELTVAQAAEAAAAGTATTAQLALNAAMKAAPYVLIISALVSVISLMGDSTNAAKESQASTAALSKSVEELNTSYSELISLQSSIFDSLGKYKDLVGELTTEQEDWLYALGQGAGLNADQVKAYADQSIEVLKLVTNLETLKTQQTSLESNASKTLASLNELVAGNKTFTGQFSGEVADYVSELERQQVVNGELDDTDKARLETAKLYLQIKEQESKVSDKILLTELQQQNVEAQKAADREKESKKRAEDERKRQEEIAKIIGDANNQALTAEQEKNLKLREIANESNKNLEEQSKEALSIEFDRNNMKIEAAKLKAQKELEIKNASDEQIAASDAAFEQQRTSLFEINVAERAAIEQKYADQRAEIAKILNEELAYGDFNLSDRKKKLALEDQSFYEQLRIKELEIQLQMGKMSVENTKATIEAIRVEKENAAITERDLKAEELDAQRQADLDLAEQQFQEGLIIKEERDAIIKALDDQAREEKKQADLEAIATIEAANAEASQRNVELKQQETNSTLQITAQGINAMQGLSDLYFAIKMANVKKGSAAEEKAAKDQFKINKALAIASATISTIQGVINALTAQSMIPEPYGTILKVVNAVAVGAAGAANIAKISSQQFQGGGGGGVTVPTVGSGGGDSGGGGSAAPIIQAASSGGFTSFAGGLVGTPGGGTTNNDNTGGGPGAQRVYVVESDITNTQRKVSVAESNATF